jgi:hypothetical protein
MTASQEQKNPKLERLQFDVPRDGSIDDMVDAIMAQMPNVKKDEPEERPKPED